jgi:hypothetical protein
VKLIDKGIKHFDVARAQSFPSLARGFAMVIFRRDGDASTT